MKITQRTNSVNYDFSKHAICDSVGNVIAWFEQEIDSQIAMEICDAIESVREVSEKYHIEPTKIYNEISEKDALETEVHQLNEIIEELNEEISELK